MLLRSFGTLTLLIQIKGNLKQFSYLFLSLWSPNLPWAAQKQLSSQSLAVMIRGRNTHSFGR